MAIKILLTLSEESRPFVSHSELNIINIRRKKIHSREKKASVRLTLFSLFVLFDSLRFALNVSG